MLICQIKSKLLHLIGEGADFTIPDNSDTKPLDVAAFHNDELIKELLQSCYELLYNGLASYRLCFPPLFDLSFKSLPRNGRKRRNAEGERCGFSWENVDEFNAETVKARDVDEIKIDSERFLNYIRDLPEEKRASLIRFANQVEVIGNKKQLVEDLIQTQKIVDYLLTVRKISTAGTQLIMWKGVLGALLREDYESLAINLGFIGGGHAFAKLADHVVLKGENLINEGKLIFGTSFKMAAPFFRRGTSGYVLYDLIRNIEEYNRGNNQTLANIIGDSIYLGLDVGEAGVELAETLEIVAEVSTITGPIVAAIGAVTFIGGDVYHSVKRVEAFNKVVHLSWSERIVEGIRAFLGIGPQDYIEQEIAQKLLYNQLATKGLEHIKNHTDIKQYVFPAGELIELCKNEIYIAEVRVSGSEYGSLGKHNGTFIREKCIPTLNPNSTAQVLLGVQGLHNSFEKADVDNPAGGEMLCAPAVPVTMEKWYAQPIFNVRNTKQFKMFRYVQRSGYTRITSSGYLCVNAMGVINSNALGNYTLIDLGNTAEKVVGTSNSPNIIMVYKPEWSITASFTGGNEDDLFIFKGDVASVRIDGGNGENTVNLSEFYPQDQSVEVDLTHGRINYHNVSIPIENINRIICRKLGRDNVTCSTDTTYVDCRRGENPRVQHIVAVPPFNYTRPIQFVIGDTKIENKALSGSFNYFISLEGGESLVNLTASNPQTRHNFVFNSSLSGLKSLNIKNSDSVTSSFLVSAARGNVNLTISSSGTNVAYFLSDSTEIKRIKNSLYFITRVNSEIGRIVSQYSTLANKLKINIVVYDLLHNETAMIGHNHLNVLFNDPSRRSHLFAGKGEDTFVITSGQDRLNERKLPIPEVTIYQLRKGNSIKTLDLRGLYKQVKDIGKELESQIMEDVGDVLLNFSYGQSPITNVVRARLKNVTVNYLYGKFHLILDKVPMEIKTKQYFDEFRQLARFPDLFFPNSSFREIGPYFLSRFYLAPLPLIFDQPELIVISPEDVVEGERIEMQKMSGECAIARSGEEDLMITNILGNKVRKNESYTIILRQFYSNPKMETLILSFTDSDILLKEEIGKITTTSTLEKHIFQYRSAAQELIFDIAAQNVTRRNRRGAKKTGHYIEQVDYSKLRATSGSSKISSPINTIIGFIAETIRKLVSLSFRASPVESPQFSTIGKNSQFKRNAIKRNPSLQFCEQFTHEVWVNNTIAAIRLFIDTKFPLPECKIVDEQEIMAHSLKIVSEFEEHLFYAASKHGISFADIDYNPVLAQKVITRNIREGEHSEIPGTLYSLAKSACPNYAQKDKFLESLAAYSLEVLKNLPAVKDYDSLTHQAEQKNIITDRPSSRLDNVQIGNYNVRNLLEIRV